MRTDNLISALQADSAVKPRHLNAVWKISFGTAVLIAAVLFFSMLGPRADIADAMQTMRFPFKFVVTIALVLSAAPLLLQMARPGERWSANALLAAPLLIAFAAMFEFLTVPSGSLEAAWLGKNALLCMVFIPLIGIVPLAIFIAALRNAAPTRPALAGALAGVLAGGLAATFYAAHCTDDSPLFVGTWYTLGIMALALLGALAGRHLLRW